MTVVSKVQKSVLQSVRPIGQSVKMSGVGQSVSNSDGQSVKQSSTNFVSTSQQIRMLVSHEFSKLDNKSVIRQVSLSAAPYVRPLLSQ